MARLRERREQDARNDGQDEKQPFRKGINPEDAEANHEDLLDRFNRAKVDHPVSEAWKLFYMLSVNVAGAWLRTRNFHLHVSIEIAKFRGVHITILCV